MSLCLCCNTFSSIANKQTHTLFFLSPLIVIENSTQPTRFPVILLIHAYVANASPYVVVPCPECLTRFFLSFDIVAAIKFVNDMKEIDEIKFNEECGVGM